MRAKLYSLFFVCPAIAFLSVVYVSGWVCTYVGDCQRQRPLVVLSYVWWYTTVIYLFKSYIFVITTVWLTTHGYHGKVAIITAVCMFLS